MTDRDDRKLRAFFREAHERLDSPPPPFAGLIRPVSETGSAPARRAATAIAAAIALVVVAGVLLLVMRGRLSSVRDDDALRLAADLGHWEAPTDFLLQTPGIEFFRETPRFGVSIDELSGVTTLPTPEEIIR